MNLPTLSDGSSTLQGPLWGARPHDWAELQEPQSRALYAAVLNTLGLSRESWLLDAGCASGVFAELASHHGAFVTGLDASEALLELARRRVPQGAFFHGDLEELPFVNQTFDVVTGFNSFQYATSPDHALAEAYRVLRLGGRIVLATWAQPEKCQAANYLRSLGELLSPSSSNSADPFALSADGALAAFVSEAGFSVLREAEAVTYWEYHDQVSALRALLSSGPANQAIESAGEIKVVRAISQFLAPFQQAHGGYRVENTFRYLVAEKPSTAFSLS